MTDEVVEEKSNRRLKTDEEKAKDKQALSEGYNRLISAVDNFFEHYGYCEGDYDEIGQGHYSRLKKAHDMLIMPKQRIGETHIVEDWNGLTDEERKTSSGKYWYENE
jgi:hypothetical protein